MREKTKNNFIFIDSTFFTHSHGDKNHSDRMIKCNIHSISKRDLRKSYGIFASAGY